MLATTHEPLARRAVRAAAQEDLRGIADLVQAALVHREHADLVGAAEAILVRAHDAKLAAVVAFEIQHGIDEMLEQPRTGDRAVLGDVPDEKGRAVRALGELHQRGRAVAHLRDAAGARFDFRQRHRLDRIDDDHARRDRSLERIEHRCAGRSPANSNKSSCAPRRSARNFVCAADSSPHTYTIGPLARARPAASCRSSVDLPAPGGPPSSTRLPGTMPPPSSRSNSPMPLGIRATAPLETSPSRTGPSIEPTGRWALVCEAFGLAVGASANVFQASQAGQRPSQRIDS
jgi:hypothetical protein